MAQVSAFVQVFVCLCTDAESPVHVPSTAHGSLLGPATWWPHPARKRPLSGTELDGVGETPTAGSSFLAALVSPAMCLGRAHHPLKGDLQGGTVDVQACVFPGLRPVPVGQRLAPLSQARTSHLGRKLSRMFFPMGTFSAPNGMSWAFGKGSPLRDVVVHCTAVCSPVLWDFDQVESRCDFGPPTVAHHPLECDVGARSVHLREKRMQRSSLTDVASASCARSTSSCPTSLTRVPIAFVVNTLHRRQLWRFACASSSPSRRFSLVSSLLRCVAGKTGFRDDAQRHHWECSYRSPPGAPRRFSKSNCWRLERVRLYGRACSESSDRRSRAALSQGHATEECRARHRSRCP